MFSPPSGFPIVNDPLYKGPEWGPNGGKGGDFGKSDEEVCTFAPQLKILLSFRLSTYNADSEWRFQASPKAIPEYGSWVKFRVAELAGV